MFTGLIQRVGRSQPWGRHELRVSWASHTQMDGQAGHYAISADLAVGDSVAVDGICLTVTQVLADGFIAAVSPETLSRTTLGRSPGQSWVNLEGSLRVGSKLGGHFVTGHIDGVGYLQAVHEMANAWEMSFTVTDARVSRYIVPKGSIAINGVSLTVADCNEDGSWFKVAVIPLTYADTNLQSLTPGSLVNLEGDVLGKYVEKFVHLQGSHSETIPTVTPEFLVEHGYG